MRVYKRETEDRWKGGGSASGTGNMQSVYDRATCCRPEFTAPSTSRAFIHPSKRYAESARKCVMFFTSVINVQKFKFRFTPHSDIIKGRSNKFSILSILSIFKKLFL